MSQRSVTAAEAAPGPVGFKAPKTERGKRTLRRLLDAAAGEFGALGFHEASIAGVTTRAGVALGTFYVYFDSKESVFRALVDDMGRMTRAFIAERVDGAHDRLTAEREGLTAFIEFARVHKDLYRIVMEAQFVAPDAYRAYYDTFAEAYTRNLESAATKGEIRSGEAEIRAWALIGMSVFLGLRYGVWNEDLSAEDVTNSVADLIANGLAPREG